MSKQILGNYKLFEAELKLSTEVKYICITLNFKLNRNIHLKIYSTKEILHFCNEQLITTTTDTYIFMRKIIQVFIPKNLDLHR